MKLFTSLIFLCLIELSAFTQTVRTHVLNAEKVLPTVIDKRRDTAHYPGNIISSGDMSGKAPGANPLMIARTSNAFSLFYSSQSPIVAIDSIGLVAYVHGQDVSLHGGTMDERGKIRYAVSYDKGQNWTTELGVLNSIYNPACEYPSTAVYPGPTGSPNQSKLIWMSGSRNAALQNLGIVSGATTALNSGTINGTENYVGYNSTRPSGIAHGLPNEYWMVSQSMTGDSITDTLLIWKGVYISAFQDISWTIHHKIRPDYSLSYDGEAHHMDPNIAFSPNGNIGWIGFPGDLVGGQDSVLSPVFLVSTDGGDTWSNPVEVNMSQFGWMPDSLKSLWVDGYGIPWSTGRPICSFDFDLTVDGTGNPHLFTVVGSGATTQMPNPGYSIYTALAKYAVDFSSTNGGATWDADLIAPILTFRVELGQIDTAGAAFTMDNFPQIARDENGNKIFYSWVDSDTLDIGFGETNNLAPNLLIVGKDIPNGTRTCFMSVTGDDPIWDGLVFKPYMAPVVMESGGNWQLPITSMLLWNSDQHQSCRYYYWGNEAVISPGDFVPMLDLNWAHGCPYLAPGLQGNRVNGKVFSDLNNNGQFDVGEPPLKDAIVHASPNYYAITDSLGEYSVGVGFGTVDVTADYPGNYDALTYPTSGNYTFTFGAINVDSNNVDFGIYVQPNVKDAMSYGATYFARPGFDWYQFPGIKNVGTTSDTITMRYESPPLTTLVSSDPPPTTQVSANIWEWEFPDVAMWESRQVEVISNVSTQAQIGDTLRPVVRAISSGTDADPSNDAFHIARVVKAAWDPNDKSVIPDGDMYSPQELFYLVRFQNTGNDTAFTVVIRDTLSELLDISTFKLLGTSHPATLSFEEREAIFTFNNILLADSFVNEPASHGFVMFSIHPEPGFALGDHIYNRAGIYFDFNPVVLTNFTDSYLTVLGTDSPLLSEMKVRIIPHPVSRRCELRIEGYDQKPYDLSIIDMQGRSLRQYPDQRSDRVAIDAQGMPSGMYFYRLSRIGHVPLTGKLLIKH